MSACLLQREDAGDIFLRLFSPPPLSPGFSQEAENVILKPIWLNADNTLILKVLLTNFQGEVSADETRIIVGGYVRDWNKSTYSKYKVIIDKGY